MGSTTEAALLAIFDHDGVLVDSLSFHEESWLEMGRREGLAIDRAFIHATFGMTNAMILKRLLGEDASSGEIARLGDVKEVCYREIARGKLTLMDGVRDLLDGLTEAGVRLAIGSSGPQANLRLTVESCGLTGRFAAIVGVEDIRHGKPDPEVFLIAAKRVGAAPGGAVVFEDAPVGIQAAKAAGMRGVGVGTTHPLEVLREAGADEVVANLVDYPVGDLVERLRATAGG